MQIVLAIIFLYRILDWSALVGFAVLCCLIPGPGYIVKMINDVLQAQTAKVRPRSPSPTLLRVPVADLLLAV
jgi:hypothetical protein